MVLVLVVLPVMGTGVVELDKFFYHPGEIATLSGFCTSPLEENAAGFAVWRNSSGVFRNVSLNSGSCRTDIFTDQFTFDAGSNFLGNVTFETSDTDWAGLDDIVEDDFNVSGIHAFDCIISEIEPIPEIVLGEVGSVKITVIDGLTGIPLVHANCLAEGYTVNETPIVIEPFGVGHTASVTFSMGEVVFMHEMDENIWEPNTDYLFEFHCYCLPTGNDEQCFLESNGTSPGFKSCTAQQPFTTGRDNRFEGNYISVILCFIALIVLFVLAGFVSESVVVKFFGYGTGLIETVLLTGFVYASALNEGMITLLRIHFLIMLIVGFGIGIYSLYVIGSWILNPESKDAPENPYKKFQ